MSRVVTPVFLPADTQHSLAGVGNNAVEFPRPAKQDNCSSLDSQREIVDLNCEDYVLFSRWESLLTSESCHSTVTGVSVVSGVSHQYWSASAGVQSSILRTIVSTEYTDITKQHWHQCSVWDFQLSLFSPEKWIIVTAWWNEQKLGHKKIAVRI